MIWRSRVRVSPSALGKIVKPYLYSTSMNDKKERLKLIQKIAWNKGGRCLSRVYVNSKTKLLFECAKKHRWWQKSDHIKAGTWCAKCNFNKLADAKRGSLKEAHEIARARGGKCLSKRYTSNVAYYRWECSNGHKWNARLYNIKSGTWCPQCSKKQGLSESICRGIFETRFNERFPSSHPRWLKNTEGNQLELDGYSEKLGIAFEYHGKQHYYDTEFYDSMNSLQKRRDLDTQKRRLCQKRGITLFEIPYKVEHKDLDRYILQILRKKGVEPPITKPIEYKKLSIYSVSDLEELQNFVRKEYNGKCLSKRYLGATTPLKFQCKEGYKFSATPNNIKRKHWCPHCYGNVRLTLRDMQKIAIKKGGKCLSTIYRGLNHNLKWQCSERHKWDATPRNVKSGGTWCPICARNVKLTIQDMQKLAKAKEGKCLSKVYHGVHNKLIWQCKEGHIFEKSPSHVKHRNQWCPKCFLESK